VERTAQRAVLTKPFSKTLNQSLICAVPHWGRPHVSLDYASAQGCAAQWSGGQFTTL